MIRRLRGALGDPLLRNSATMLATTVLLAVVGAVFWVVVARVAARAEVGLASSLATAAEALAVFAQLGLNVSLVKTMPGSDRRSSDVAVSAAVVGATGVILALGYALALPAIAPALAHVVAGPVVVAGFALVVVATALNHLTDGIFLGIDRVRDNLWVNGIAIGVVKLAVPFALVGAGAFAIFGGLGAATALAALVSLAVIFRRLPGRPTLRPSRELLRSVRLSGAGYLAGTLYIVPQLVFPVIVIDVRGAAASAVYFVGFQVVTLLNAGVYAIANSMYAEVARAPRRAAEIVARAGRAVAAVVGAGIVVVGAGAPLLLRVFGDSYAAAGTTTLRVLALGSIGVGLNYWAAMRLRIAHHLRAMIGVQAATTAVMVALAVLVAPLGIEAVAAAWGVGQLAGGVAGYVVSRTLAPLSRAVPRPRPGLPTRSTVAVVAPRYLEVGGMEGYVRRVAGWLRDADDVDVVAIASHPGRGRLTTEVDGIPVVLLGSWFTVSNTPVNPLWPLQLHREFRRHRVALVHAHSPVPGFADAALLAAGRRPTVLTYHSGSMVKGCGGPVDAVLRGYERYVLPLVFARADRLVSVSPTAVSERTGRAVTIPPGVDAGVFADRATPGPRPAARPQPGRSVVFVGRVESTSRWKGLHVLLAAFAELASELPSVTLEVVGGGDAVPDLQAEADRLGIAHRVRWHGALGTAQVAAVLQRAAVTVLPSVTDAESFGMALIEAMACGSPVIGSRMGGIPFVVRDEVDGLLVPAGDTGALAAAVRRVLTDPAMAARLGRAGRQAVVERWDWSLRQRETLDLVRETLVAGPRRGRRTRPAAVASAAASPARPAVVASPAPAVGRPAPAVGEPARILVGAVS